MWWAARLGHQYRSEEWRGGDGRWKNDDTTPIVYAGCGFYGEADAVDRRHVEGPDDFEVLT